jgi:hypothetical protein
MPLFGAAEGTTKGTQPYFQAKTSAVSRGSATQFFMQNGFLSLLKVAP